MNHHGQPGHGWTVVLRRQHRIVDGEPEGGYTDMYELICCDCGDDPGLTTGRCLPSFSISAAPISSRRHRRLRPPRQAVPQAIAGQAPRHPAEGVTPTRIACPCYRIIIVGVGRSAVRRSVISVSNPMASTPSWLPRWTRG